MDTRRYDLDWLRVIVFGLLIFYHVGMFFVPWGWHIKNEEPVLWMQYPMIFLNKWRLPILFVISGMGTCFALSKRSQGIFIKERFSRLFIPLVVGIIILIAPQVYVERIAYDGYMGAFSDFYFQDFFTSGVYPKGNFSWHHLWFLPYLLIYSVVFSPLMIYFRNNPRNKFIVFIEKFISTKLGLFAFLVPILIVYLLLRDKFPTNHAVWEDWYTLSYNGILFFYGFLFVAIQDSFWKTIKKVKLNALALALITYGLYIFLRFQEKSPIRDLSRTIVTFLYMGSSIIALFGYAATYLNKKSKLLAYCNQAVYPFYIIHQTITVICGYYLYKSSMHYGWKFLILTIATFSGSWVFFELVKRTKITRVLFGIKQKN